MGWEQGLSTERGWEDVEKRRRMNEGWEVMQRQTRLGDEGRRLRAQEGSLRRMKKRGTVGEPMIGAVFHPARDVMNH